MALAHAILALLADCPQSGYDLNKTFEESVGCFWKATHQQIYRELGKIEAQGWVHGELISQSGRPDKKVYQITEQGLQALTDWMVHPCDPSPTREDLLVKVFVGSLAKPDVIQYEIQRHRQLHHAKLECYQKMLAQFFPEPNSLAKSAVFPYLTLRRGIRYEQEWVEWCDEALEQLGRIDVE